MLDQLFSESELEALEKKAKRILGAMPFEDVKIFLGIASHVGTIPRALENKRLTAFFLFAQALVWLESSKKQDQKASTNA